MTTKTRDLDFATLLEYEGIHPKWKMIEKGHTYWVFDNFASFERIKKQWFDNRKKLQDMELLPTKGAYEL